MHSCMFLRFVLCTECGVGTGHVRGVINEIVNGRGNVSLGQYNPNPGGGVWRSLW